MHVSILVVLFKGRVSRTHLSHRVSVAVEEGSRCLVVSPAETK